MAEAHETFAIICSLSFGNTAMQESASLAPIILGLKIKEKIQIKLIKTEIETDQYPLVQFEVIFTTSIRNCTGTELIALILELVMKSSISSANA